LFNEPTLEYVAEMSRETILHFGHFDGPAEQSGQRGYTAISDAAGDDEAKVCEVGRDIEREAVAGDPA
jgi:hypothetical protein